MKYSVVSSSDVVSYRNSTSNHNAVAALVFVLLVVSYRNSTSNHNIESDRFEQIPLYLIEILHQTTTRLVSACFDSPLYLIEILHQTTTSGVGTQRGVRVVSYRNSTSNHNRCSTSEQSLLLYLIEILHQTTTLSPPSLLSLSCILSKFYIKPQPIVFFCVFSIVVSYRNSTSNHNFTDIFFFQRSVVSYRNSTSNHNGSVDVLPGRPVVSYRNSTSNHNSGVDRKVKDEVVSYRNSTSNHNRWSCIPATTPVVSYRNSTSNHNSKPSHCSIRLVVSYRNSTSNHNISVMLICDLTLYLIEILHQTTTS